MQSKAFIYGFCSLPFANRKSFIHDQIKENIFKSYKKGIVKNNNYNELNNQSLFEPTCYYLWGKYDVCVISQVDDLEFATRFFRPYNPIEITEVEPNLQNFDYKVLTGINPIIHNNTNEKLPYIAISEFKVNSAFLIGNGLSLLTNIEKKLISFIKEEIADSDNQYHINYSICESYSYHELIVTLQSDSITALKDVISKLRSLQIGEFKKECKDYLANSLFYDFIDQQHDGSVSKKIKRGSLNNISNHIFESSITTFGVHSEIYDNDNFSDWDGLQPIDGEEIVFVSKWNVKPGHLNEVLSLIAESPIDIKQKITVAGRGDLLLIHQVKIEIEKMLTGKGQNNNPLYFPGNLYVQKLQNSKLYEHLIETYTTIGFDLTNTNRIKSEKEYSKVKHFNIHDELEYLQISPKIIANTRTQMKKLRIPKVLSDKVIKIFSNYNNAVRNTDMYAYYTELYPSIINSLIKNIDDYYKAVFADEEDTKYYVWDLIVKIENTCTYLEYGFENRFYQSYWTSEMIEVNIDYSGGLQNLLSAYDSCFKSLNNAYLSNLPNASFVCIKSDHRVSATTNALLLNYMHLIQPYIFSAIAIHESSNFVFDKLYRNEVISEQSMHKDEVTKLYYLLKQANILPDIEFPDPDITSSYPDVITFTNESQHFIDFKNELDKSKYKLSYFINEDYFHYFLTDYINFSYGYEKDYSLFCKTSWNYFIQLGNNFKRNSIIDPSAFVGMSIRMALLKEFSNSTEDYYPESLVSFLEDSFIDLYKDEINVFVSKVSKNTEMSSWFSNIAKNVDSLISSLTKKDNQQHELDSIFNNLSAFLFNNNDDINIDTIVSEIDLYFRSSIEHNKNCLLPIYKFIINSTIKFYSKNISFLYRDDEFGNPELYHTDYSNSNAIEVYIDQCGGTFVIGEENRKQYLLARVKFIRIMFHLAQLDKKQYVSEILFSNKLNKQIVSD